VSPLFFKSLLGLSVNPFRPDSLSSWAKATPQRMRRHAAPQRRAFNLEPWVYVGKKKRGKENVFRGGK